MDNIINLLWDKNYHLQRFRDMNEAELVNFVEGNFDRLEVFYNTREAILDLIRCIDRLIEQANLAAGDQPQVTEDQREEIRAALKGKSDLVTKILSQDLQILSVLGSAKSNIIKELSQVRAARKAVGAYKSGDGTKRLDEKA